jgi:tetratricopeptide (TPR) repeat protein
MNQARWLPAILLAGATMLLPGRLTAAPDATPARASAPEVANLETPGAFLAPATDEADSLFNIAGQLYAQRRFREAIPLFLRVIEIDSRNGNAYALLGGSYFQLGDYAEAIGAFERAIQLDEGIKLAYLGLVAANYMTERAADAQHWLLKLIPILSGEERDRYLATLSSQFPGLELPGS